MSFGAEERQRGAPIRVLIAILGLWTIGRMAWISLDARDIPHQTTRSTILEVSEPTIGESAECCAAVNNNLSAEQPDRDATNYSKFYLSEKSTSFGDQENLAKYSSHGSVLFDSGQPQTVREASPFSFAQPTPEKKSTLESEADDLQDFGTLALSDRPMERSRFTGYAWFFLHGREGRELASNIAPVTNFSPSYGGSQAGIILGYRLSNSSLNKLAIYGRASVAKQAARIATEQEEFAIGFRGKPLAKVPVTLHIEQRFDARSMRNNGTALFVSSGTGPTDVYDSFELETYGQAGIVLDKRDDYFADGALTLQKPIVRSDRKRLSLGVGIWAGGQRGASRIDIGPRADIRLPIANNSARISLDWRQKVEGNALPESSLALTVSAGF